jgi:hypothetical protein
MEICHLVRIGGAAGIFAFSAASLTIGCTTENAATSVLDAGVDSTSTADASGPGDASPDAAVDAGADGAGPSSSCAAQKAYLIACGGDAGDLTCGAAKFDAWCEATDSKVNSAQRKAAVIACSTSANCDSTKRADCEYRSYAAASLTVSQASLVQHYCETCAPTAVLACSSSVIQYDSVAGPSAATDIFLAAWELADSLTQQVDAKCTRSALDGGPDASCEKAFAECSGGLYIDALPDCP